MGEVAETGPTEAPGPVLDAAQGGQCGHRWGAWGVQAEQESRSGWSILPSRNGFDAWLPRLDSNQRRGRRGKRVQPACSDRAACLRSRTNRGKSSVPSKLLFDPTFGRDAIEASRSSAKRRDCCMSR